MTSTQQLADACKDVKNFLGVFAADELPNYIEPKIGGSSLISNYSPSNDIRGGTHWIAMLNLMDSRGLPAYFFDSYGTKPNNDDGILKLGTNFSSYLTKNSFTRKYRYNKFDLQAYRDPVNSGTCGEWSVYCIKNGGPISDGNNGFIKNWRGFRQTTIMPPDFKPNIGSVFQRSQKNEDIARLNDRLVRKRVGIIKTTYLN